MSPEKHSLGIAAALFALHSSFCFGYPLTTLKVSGDGKAEIRIETARPPVPPPQMEISDRGIAVDFPGAELDSSLGGKLLLKAPHALLSEVTATQPESGRVRVMVKPISGDAKEWKNRAQLETSARGAKLTVVGPRQTVASPGPAALPANAQSLPPKGSFEDEQLPIEASPVATPPGSPRFHFRDFFLMALVFLMAGAGTVVFVRFLKRKGAFPTGSRKYLIEQLSYCNLNGKSGVSLLKIGREFVLVGVTGEQVTLLSNLPKLEAQYEDEAQFERGAFKAAVNEELSRLHDGPRAVT